MQLRYHIQTTAILQVVYPGDNVSIPVNVTGSRIAAPAAVTYQLAPQTPVAKPFLLSVNGSLGGVLRWDPQNGGSTEIAVPLEWSQVSNIPFEDAWLS